MTRRPPHRAWLVLPALLAASACMAEGVDGEGGRAPAAAPVDDPRPDSLYADFLDGKFDEAGHPVGATVMQAEDGCEAETGRATTDGARTFAPGHDEPGLACTGQTRRLGRGRQTVNVRAALLGCGDRDCERATGVLEVIVTDGEGATLGEQLFDVASFEGRGAYENVATTFYATEAGEVLVEVRWLGEAEIAIDYVEIFRQDRQLVLSPASGVIDDAQSFRVELIDPADEALPRISCNGEDRTELLAALLADGVASDERTDFRRILTVPQGELFDGCGPDRVIEVSAREAYGYGGPTSEARYLAEPPPCAFEGDGRVRVLLTGFVPFPAGSRSTNSSSLAVSELDPAAVPDAQVMRLYLPVEFEAAAAIVRDAIERCDPHVVVGFGQGRHRVDLETTAYNRRDTSEVSGGVPDNRGVILDGAPVEEGGPDTVMTRLPIEAIATDIAAAGIEVGTSTDPGLYVCNDLFYSIVRATDESTRAGFVHLPRVFSPTEEDARELRTVVEAVVRETAALFASGA